MPASTTLLAELSLLQEVHFVFLQAEILPTKQDAKARVNEHDAQTESEESDDVANITNSLSLLKSTMKTNNARAGILKQHRDNQKVRQQVWAAIEAKLRLHLEALEQLVDSSVLENMSSVCIVPVQLGSPALRLVNEDLLLIGFTEQSRLRRTRDIVLASKACGTARTTSMLRRHDSCRSTSTRAFARDA